MKKTSIFTAILMFASFAAQAIIVNPMDYKDKVKAYNDYVELLKQHDVFITLPPNFSPESIRGLSDVKNSLGNGDENLNIHCQPLDIGAIVEDDSCKVAICYPQIMMDVPGNPKPIYFSTVHGSSKIEADLRMINDDMHLDVRPMVKIIAEDDMSQYANADTVAFYNFATRSRFMDNYDVGVGIYLRKKNHPAMLLRVMFNRKNDKDKEKFIRAALDNIHYGDNPSATYVEFEKKEMNILQRDFRFPSHYPVFTGILDNINDETLEEIKRVKAWCEAHGMKELPKVDDDMLEALNRRKEAQRFNNTIADSILNSDMPDDKKILRPFMCDSQAEFPEDDEFMSAYREWINKHIIYPKEALAEGVEGKVLVNFTVCADGSIKDIAIDNQSGNKSGEESLKQEAIRLFKTMPRWTPATYKGKAVNSREIRYVNFKIPQTKSQPDVPATVKQIAEEKRLPQYIYDMKSIPGAPVFKGGSQGLEKWIQEHIQYPPDAVKAKIEGRVIVEFIIDKTGAVTFPKVVRGINDVLNNEAVRVIKSLPRWTPGYAHGKPANTRYTYPVTFKLAKAK